MPTAVKKLYRKVHVARRHGAQNVAIALTQKLIQFPLFLMYRGERWHLRGYHTTNYKKMAVHLAKEISSDLDVVVEVGCGLGEIVNRVGAQRKFGLDIDQRVISWARFLQRFNRSDVEFHAGSFDTLAETDLEVIDLLITTGWFHYMSDEWIDTQIRKLLEAKHVRYIMVDEFPYQRGRIQRIFDTIATRVEQRHDWQDDKILFLYRCKGRGA
ncbi:methyltransferase domain-containing protein [Nonomuraea sp. 3N208]|uniref:methyltransferase domain-containing protein n=1 Tax=Nonomuraea sp. 3N208 TaxID=3457421 RepID=UPI003FD19C69